MLNLIGFSKDRPLQLHGSLTSLLAHTDSATTRVSVLTVAQGEYVPAYLEVQAQFPSVRFVSQDNFAPDIYSMLDDSEYTCFFCDDVLAVRDIVMSDVETVLKDESVIGVSLRLGQHITRGFFSSAMAQPTFSSDNSMLTWDMNGADQDWCYPWDVLGTIYRTDFVHAMWPHVCNAQNPSEFEATGAQVWTGVTAQRRYACWPLARTVVPTVNVVQSVFPNGWIGQVALPPELLLLCWNFGMRLDLERFAQQTYDDWRIGDFFLRRR